MNNVNVAGIKLSVFNDVDEAVNHILSNLLNDANIAVAINPEKVIAYLQDTKVKAAIDSASFRYMDGIGVVKVAERKLGRKVSRIPGCELWLNLMKLSARRKVPVYILGATDQVVLETVKKLELDFDANIVGFNDGYFESEDKIIDEIISCQPRILTVALGSPRQEQFMEKCREKGADFFMMGVGGTYNVFTGSVARAPKVWCDLGLEWLYRVLKEPKRIFRQVNLLKFLFLAIRKKI